MRKNRTAQGDLNVAVDPSSWEHPNCLQHGVEADLVAVLEAVGERLLARVHLHRDPVELVRFDAGLVRGLA
jgi:hypothetical protein